MKKPRAPNSAVVLRRFMAGESVESQAWRETVLEFRASGGRFLIHDMIRPAYRRIVEYEAALRRAFNRADRQRRRTASAAKGAGR